MSWRGRLSLTVVLVSVAAWLGMATMAGAAPLPPSYDLGQLSPFKLADGTPRGLGPSIIDAVYRATTPAGAGNDSLFVIFNKDLTPASVNAITDFRFKGAIAGGSIARVDRNLAVLTGFTTAYAAGDSISLAERGVVTDLSGGENEDVSLVQIRTGPAIWRVELRSDVFDMSPNNDTMRIYFTHEITGGIDVANPRLDFNMPEFGTGAANLTTAAVVPANRYVDVTFGNQEATGPASHGKVLAQISKIALQLTAGITGNFATAGDATSETSSPSVAPGHIVNVHWDTPNSANVGPYLIAVGFNDRGNGFGTDDVLTLVFSKDVDPSTVAYGDFTFGGGATAPTNPPVITADGSHIIRMTDFTGAAAIVGGNIAVSGSISDFQGSNNPPAAANTITIAASPILVYARYQDGGDADPATDELQMFFDTPVIGSFAGLADFDTYGFDKATLTVTENSDNDSLLTLIGFTVGNPWKRGSRVGIAAGSDLQSVNTANGGNGAVVSQTGFASIRWARDGSQPRTLHFVENVTYSRDTQGPVAAVADTAFIAFNEVDIDDACYYALFARKNADVTPQFMRDHLNNAVFVMNPKAGSATLDRNLITTYIITPGVGLTSNGETINAGDIVRFGVVAVDQDGNIALDTTSRLFFGGLISGVVPAPRDHDCVAGVAVPGTTTDTDMIHITGTRNPEEHFIFGDAGSAIGADSIRVYDDAGLTTLLGSGPANPATGSFAIFSIGVPSGDFVYVTAVDLVGAIASESGATAIRNDRDLDNLYAATFRDPLNALQRYSPGDTVRILGAAVDTAGPQSDGIVVPSMTFKSDLLALSADFRGFSTRAGSDSVVFISLGANKNDEDNDWLDNGPTRFDGTVISGNGIKDYPEPYVDENGNGQYDCGETFVDYSGPGYTANIYDYGDSNLDSNDPEEHGWYYAEYWIDPNDATLVPDPDGGDNFAVFENVNIPVRILDNAITSQASLDLLSSELPGQADRQTMTYPGANLSMSHLTNAAGDSAFVASIDALAPTVSEISYVAKMTSLLQASTYPAGNIITPGDRAYQLPAGMATPYINLVDSTLSDDDVIFVALQIDDTPNSADDVWKYLSADPPGDNGGGAAGSPGIPLVDDDYDSTLAKTNGLDDDEDGLIDEDGEGVDFSDAQVTDAMQADAAADAAALGGGDGIHRTNDRIDNDNDAFFRYNAFTGEIIWFNIDESITNGVDDDGDGLVDEADEVENYNAALDDDEDGMQDGTVATLSLGALAGGYSARTIADVTNAVGGAGIIGVRAFENPAILAKYAGSVSTKPVPSGVGMTPGSYLMSYLDKTSDVIGNVSTAFAQGGGKDDFANTAFAYGARNIISTTNGYPVGLRNGPGTNAFAFDYRARVGRNIDLSRVKALYNLVDGSEYRIRAVAVDEAYNHNPNWAVPFRFTLDSTAPVVCIPPAHNSATPGTGAAPEFDGFVDVKPAVPGLQVYDKGAHPGPYTLQADVVSGNDIKEVYFQMWDGAAWVNMPAVPANPDESFPYTLFWDAPLLNNMPPANADTFYFRAYAVDIHGNTEAQFLLNDEPTPANGPAGATCVDDARVWELQVIVIDGTAPQACLCQVGSDYDLSDGAQVPVESAVDVSAWFTDNDGVVGTNDVIHVYFEHTPIGLNAWTPFASLTGVPADGFLRDPSGIQHPVIATGPDTLKTTVTWDTRLLAAGSYEIRAVAVDIEGNTSVLTSCVFTVTLDNSPLRAYIQPVVVGSNSLDTCGIAAVDTLYAQVFIHDRSVAKVEFQYYADTDGNGAADDGNTWHTIFIQGDDVSERKGDVTLRAGRVPFQRVDGAPHVPMNTIGGGLVKYWDPDGDGYSSIDPVVGDSNNNNVYDAPDYTIYQGTMTSSQPPLGSPLKTFPDNEYLAVVTIGIDEDDYIMQDNPLNAGAEQTDVWRALWDVTGLSGNHLVRAVATDQLGNTDSGNIPTAEIEIDSSIPSAQITSITLQDKTTFNIPPQGQYISASNSFFHVNATTTDTDIKKVLFQYSTNGGVTWTNLDVNDDQDMYSDLNQNWQFDAGIDEIFIDVDGSCTYSAGDIVLSKGSNGVIDTPLSGPYAALFPLVGEDPNDSVDNDGDGKVDEDDFGAASTLGGQSPDDYFAPYSVPFMFHNLMFPTETNVNFRAIAMDNAGNTDCDPEIVSVVVGDNKAPETDVVVAVIDGDSLDIETVLRGTVNPLCLDDDSIAPMYLLVTAEDQAEILGIDIYYRVVDENFDPWDPEVAWTAAGLTDATYPYEFNWDITTLADGTYEFFARAEDANGNFTHPPTNPYRFSIMRETATISTVAFLGSGLPAGPVAPGDVVVISADVTDPSLDGQVCFYYAPRIEGEVVRNISTTFPYISGALVEDMVPATGNGINEVVTIGGVDGIYIAPAQFNAYPGKTFLHYTVRSGDRLEFGSAIPAGQEVVVSYNIGSFNSIACDTEFPYTTEWTIPTPMNSNTTHIDLASSFSIDNLCEENIVSEGRSLRVLDVQDPEFTVYGIDDVDDDNEINTSDDNWPGNALCVSRGLDYENSGIGQRTMKLSSDWAEFFLRSDEIGLGEDDDFHSVIMVVTHTFDGASADTCVFQKMPIVDDPPQLVHKQLHLSDFPTLDPARVENVTITVSGFQTAPATRTYAMYDDGTHDDVVAGDGVYTIDLHLDPRQGSVSSIDYSYMFKIDLVGADFINTYDPRNDGSFIRIPALPYWWCSTRLDDNSLFHENDINHVKVVVTDHEGNVATNISENNQGQIDVIVDREAPVVANMTIDRPQVAPGSEVEVFAIITDTTPTNINIISVPSVLFQVSPDAARSVWIDWFTDSDPSNGWGGVTGWGFNPLTDNIDNDLDGIFDEADESAFVYQIRAVPTDDCYNVGYSNLQAPPVFVEVSVDATAPACVVSAPANGDIFPHGSTINIQATGLDTDVLYVSFQYNTGSGWKAIDATPGNNNDPVDSFNGNQTPAFPVDGAFSVNWNTSFLAEADFYVRLRCVARDRAGNFSGNLSDPFGTPGSSDPTIEYITILINDQTAPFAALTQAVGNGLAYLMKSVVDPTLAISDQAIMIGVASGGLNGDVATVIMQYSLDGTNWLDGGISNALFQVNATQSYFGIYFDTKALGLPDGPVWLRTAAMDHDGNLQGDTNGNGKLDNSEVVTGTVKVHVDNSAPAMWLTQVGPVSAAPLPDHTLIQYDLWPREVLRGGEFEVDNTSLRLSDDLTFKAADPQDGSVDVLDHVYLQFYDDFSDPEHPRWVPGLPSIPELDADQNHVIDSSELGSWFSNLDDYLDDLESYRDSNSNWKFSFRDAAGNNGPAGPASDGNWYLTFGSIYSLKSAMGGGFSKVGTNVTNSISLLPDKEYQFRALAVDYAGNANTGYPGHTLRIDATDPTVEEIFAGNREIEGGGGGGLGNPSETVLVAGGDDVPLAALVIDDYAVDLLREPNKGLTAPNGFDPDLPGTISESSGIHGVRFDYSPHYYDDKTVGPILTGSSPSWTTIGLGTYNPENGLWEITWKTPNNLSRTGPQAGQGSSSTDSLYAVRAVAVDSAGNYGTGERSDAVSVQDITPPDDTEIVDINGRTYPPVTNEETVRDAGGTWVAGEVSLLAATQYGDASMISGGSQSGSDVFVPTVFFEAKRRGTDNWLLIGSSTNGSGGGIISAPGVTQLQSHQGPIWSVSWNTNQLNGAGNRMWSDGQYDVRAYGRDAWGNTEILTGAEAPRMVLVTIDNSAPIADVDANPVTSGVEKEATVERNNPAGYTFLVRTPTNDEDVVMSYWYKLSTDLNIASAWQMVGPGFDATDVNPDNNRPYSFDWDVNAIADCDQVLIPGETYDIVAEATDLVGNTLSRVAAHDAGYSMRMHVVDTNAPRAHITELRRNVGNTNPVEFPNGTRVRGLEYLQGTILNGHRDVESVQFWYTPKTGATAPAFSTGTWTLADGDVAPVGAETWRLTNWDSSPLAEGEYWFAAVAEDCYNNRDAAPPTIVLIIDRTGPVFTAVSPVTNAQLKAQITSESGARIYDLIVRNTDNDVDYTTFSNNAIMFQYKKSETADREDNWTTITSQELKDNGSGTGPVQPTFAAAINLRNLQGDGLYDWRVYATDVAGNTTKFVWATKTVVDNTPPVVEITNVQFPNRSDLTVQPVNNGILPDISAGELVKLFVTGSDNEPQIPQESPWHTRLHEVQFFLSSGPGGSGTYPQTLGTAGYDAGRDQYFINWNTTGLPDGNYVIYAKGQDDVRNFGTSQNVTGNVTNPAKPLAQVSAFNPDLLSEVTKGTNSRIYGLTFGEKLANTVFFQYRTVPSSGSPSDWVNIGSATKTDETNSSREAGLLPQSLWFSNMRISEFADGTVMDFRSVAVGSSTITPLADGTPETEPASQTETAYYGREAGKGLETQNHEPGDFSGLYDLANTPILQMVKRSTASGQAWLEFNSGPNLISGLSTQSVNFSSNGLFTVQTTDARVSPFVVMVAEDGSGAVDESLPLMSRRIDDGTVWTGDILGNTGNFTSVNPTLGARVGLFASAHLKRANETALTPRTDMKWKTWWIHRVTPNAGSNGVAGIDGNGRRAVDNYPTDNFAVEVPPGGVASNSGMLLERVARPVTPAAQDLYISSFGPTYSVRFMNSGWNAAYNDLGQGWMATGWIRYNDKDPAIKNESQISVRYWSGSTTTGWAIGNAIQQIEVDTLANVVKFRFDATQLDENTSVFSLIATDRFSPVQVDAYPYSRGYTDQDPIFSMTLTNIYGTPINTNDIRIFVDKVEVAAVRNGQNWLRWSGSWMDVDQMDPDGRQYQIKFAWPCDNALGLKEGQHELEVWFSDAGRVQYFGVDQPWVFTVDKTAPTVVMNGAFVGDPRQNNTPAYVGTDANAITVKLIDTGSGVLFREDRIDDDEYSAYWWTNIEDDCKIARYGLLYDSWFYENYIPIQFDDDNSFKYDLWRVNNPDHDNQTSIDTIEERTLLHTGTADEVWPNVTTSLNGDTLTVPLYILGGGQIKDGDVLEVVIYSKRYETAPINQLNEYLDEICAMGCHTGGDSDYGWWIDFSTKRLVQYASSIQDNVCNAGSRFVEQRFIVDKTAPEINVTSAGVSCDGSQVTPIEPTTDYTFTANFDETGSGVKVSTVTVAVSGPVAEGDKDGAVTITNLEVTEGGISFTIPADQLLVGQYTIRLRGSDKLGNKFDKSCRLYVGGSRLTLTDMKAYPNPFNPRETDVTMSFINDREASVTITIYDFNGEKVRTINAGQLGVGRQSIKWGGDAEDGTPLANGAYLARIEAKDGRRTEAQTIKVAIWRD